uniref:Conserved virulence factor B-like winged helix domain-containing protein n=1 Tax=Timspurckia oligopyrenoides TaxID=708627 RepID=A0A7S0ZJ12_9RHOD|mmetsp:Transcript_7206/g.12989  ORF Transcript_7206/g.12989 Transcript_7206/m.12989 type:complete len:448 (+) Transcript_7206:80-1423(+)
MMENNRYSCFVPVSISCTLKSSNLYSIVTKNSHRNSCFHGKALVLKPISVRYDMNSGNHLVMKSNGSENSSSFNFYSKGNQFNQRDALGDINRQLETEGGEETLGKKQSNKNELLKKYTAMDAEERMNAPDSDIDAKLFRERIGKKQKDMVSFPGLVSDMTQEERLGLSAELGLKFNSKVRVVMEGFDEDGARVAVTVPKQLQHTLKGKHLPKGYWLEGHVSVKDLDCLSESDRLWPGDEVIGFVRKIRSNGVLEVSLFALAESSLSGAGKSGASVDQSGERESFDPKERIREELRVNDGFLPLTDASEPEQIRNLLLMEKLTFKVAIGSLLRDREIVVARDGIRATEALAPRAARQVDPRWRRDEEDQLPIRARATRTINEASRYSVAAERNFFKTRYNENEATFEDLELLQTLRKDDRSPLRRTEDPPGVRVHRRYTNLDFKIVG